MALERARGRVTIVDYGLGNLFSLRRALEYLGWNAQITAEPQDVAAADRLILPGVGAFGDGMRQLRERQLLDSVQEAVRGGRPLLGICLGMQLLFDEGEEFGRHEGLGLLPGRVVRLRDVGCPGARVKVPHIGWSELWPTRGGWGSTVLDAVPPGEAMYFVHSYVPVPEQPDLTLAELVYGGHRYAAAVRRARIVGCQFHPEKSGPPGLRVLSNFLHDLI